MSSLMGSDAGSLLFLISYGPREVAKQFTLAVGEVPKTALLGGD